ncbi:MAG: GMC family oxidoreductase [Cyanobacteria bacterium]|nr:GMC family oxidoreductase [Cyanobacteriota bacterium]
MPWSADVVIVGSGVAGSLVACRLARAGVKVVVLEAGPRVQRTAALAQYRRALIKVPESPYPDMPHAPHPVSDNPDRYFLQNGPDTFASAYLRQVGGTTWHWLGTTLRFVPDDFRLRSKFGIAVDWPISYGDLEPWYGEAERELGVAGDPEAELQAPRSQPYAMPMIPLSYSDQRTIAALHGTPYRVVATPQARNSQRYDNRPACCGSASCIPICPVQAKYDATSHVSQAERAGAQVVADAVVTRVDVAADGRISGLVVTRPDRTEDRATARVFVIAAHGIETPKLLLQSRTERLPSGVANSSDHVGRNLMDHPSQLNWALAGEPLGMFRGPMSTAGIEHTRAGDWRRDHASFRIQVDNRGWAWPAGAPESTARALSRRGLRGADLDRAIADHSSRQITLTPMVEQLPSPANRIVPDFDQRDAIGVPRPRITYRIDGYSKRALEHGRRIAREVFAAMRATETHEAPGYVASGHVMGTYRMGTDPKQSVVNPDQRAHDHPNLFLLGSGVFPTGAASNPTLTIAALALRAVEEIRKSV